MELSQGEVELFRTSDGVRGEFTLTNKRTIFIDSKGGLLQHTIRGMSYVTVHKVGGMIINKWAVLAAAQGSAVSKHMVYCDSKQICQSIARKVEEAMVRFGV